MPNLVPPIPKRLRQEPLVEAIWEIRFSSNIEMAGELLPGLLFKRFRGSYPKIERLPAANLPPPLLKRDEKLRYSPTIRLAGERYSIQIGEHVVSLSCPQPYTGWEAFKQEILKIVRELRETDLLSFPERFSLRYINIITFEGTDLSTTLSTTNIAVRLGNYNIINNPIFIRTEIADNDLIHIIQIASPAQVKTINKESVNGILIDIDTIYNKLTGYFWSDFEKSLNYSHDKNKYMFFSLLTAETVTKLGPEY